MKLWSHWSLALKQLAEQLTLDPKFVSSKNIHKRIDRLLIGMAGQPVLVQ